MSEVSDMLQRYREIRQRLRYPPNAVPDTGINLKRKPVIAIETPTELEYPRSSSHYSPFVSNGLIFSSTLEITANEFGLSGKDLHKRCRIRAICFPRQVAIYVAAKQGRWSTSWIGTRLKLDHTTILHAKSKIATLIETNPRLKNRVQSIEAAVAALNPPALSHLNEPDLEEGTPRVPSERPVLEVDQGSRSTFCDEQDRPPQDD